MTNLTATSRHSRQLANLTPAQQLRAGRLGRRVPQLFAGLVLYGVSMALMVRGALGLQPWDVLHYGIANWVPLSFGAVVIVTGVAVLLLWIPLRQSPGLGTVANAVVIGLVADTALAVLVAPAGMAPRLTMLAGGIVLNALATALYIGAQLGPGPRDGLMTGLVRRTGWSVRVVRTSIELTVVASGWVLGGVVGLGTIAYAVTIGPLVQAMLPWVIVELRTSSGADSSGTSPRTAPDRGGRRSASRPAAPGKEDADGRPACAVAWPKDPVTASPAEPAISARVW